MTHPLIRAAVRVAALLATAAPATAASVVVRSWTPSLVWLDGFSSFKTNYAIEYVALMSTGRVVFVTIDLNPRSGTSYTMRVVDCAVGKIGASVVAKTRPEVLENIKRDIGLSYADESIYSGTPWARLARVACAAPGVAGNNGQGL